MTGKNRVTMAIALGASTAALRPDVTRMVHLGHNSVALLSRNSGSLELDEQERGCAMPNQDLDINRGRRPTRRITRTLLAATLLLGTAFSFAGTLQAGPASITVPAPPAHTAPLPPSNETTASIGGLGMAVRQLGESGPSHQSSLPLRERHVLIALLMLCFAVLSLGGYALWRRSFAELERNQ